MRSLYWKICGTFVLVVLASVMTGLATFRAVWSLQRQASSDERTTRQTEPAGSESARRSKSARGLFRALGGRTGSPVKSRYGPRLTASSLGVIATLAATAVGQAFAEHRTPEAALQAFTRSVGPQVALTAAYILPGGTVGAGSSELSTVAAELLRENTGVAVRTTYDRHGGYALAPANGGWVVVSLEAEPQEATDPEEVPRHFMQSLAAAVGVMLLVALGLGLVSFLAIARRLSRVGTALRAAGAGHLEARIPDQGSDELGDLGRSFNVMAAQLQSVVAKLEQVDESRRVFLAEVSHELRTPLTSLRANLETLVEQGSEGLAGAGPVHASRELSVSLEEVDAMSRLVEDLLELARMDSPEFRLVTEECVLQRLVSGVVSRLETSARIHGLHVVTRFSPEPLRRAIDRRRFEQIATNVIVNALQSLSDGGTIEVIVEERDGRACLEVVDDGPGMPDEELARAFERFHSGRRGGLGLGLAIVQRLVAAHGGTVELHRRDPRGTCVTVRL